MSETAKIMVLALIQGITEFIPISSSGHLVLIREWLQWSDKSGIFVDTALHAASLAAVFVYFRRDWKTFLLSFFHKKPATDLFHKHLLLLLILATIPVVIGGPFLEPLMPSLRSGAVIAFVMLGAGLWFFLAEGIKHKCRKQRWFLTAFLMGVAQVIAILPGASRSGLTIGAGLMCGQQRTDAAKFSFFMAVPAILGATIWEGKAMLAAESHPAWSILGVGFGLCFLVSLASISLCMHLFRTHSLMPFGVYLILLSIVLFSLANGGA